MTVYSITEEMVRWLAGLGFAASTEPPKTGNEFVTVERTGGAVTDMVDHPAVAVQCWARSAARAEEMANAVRIAALTGELPRGVRSMRVNSGPYPYFDESTRLPRYQIFFTCTAQLVD